MRTLAALALLVYTVSQCWVYPTQGGISFGIGSLGYHLAYDSEDITKKKLVQVLPSKVIFATAMINDLSIGMQTTGLKQRTRFFPDLVSTTSTTVSSKQSATR